MTDMIERVARAIHVGTLYAPWDEMQPEARSDFMGHARRAIEAMREPTPEMSDAAHDRLAGDGSVENVYTTMIDTALTQTRPDGG